MQQHAASGNDLTERGPAIGFGPVSDPAGAWGLAGVEAESEQPVHQLGVDDSAVRSELAKLELLAMPGAIAPA